MRPKLFVLVVAIIAAMFFCGGCTRPVTTLSPTVLPTASGLDTSHPLWVVLLDVSGSQSEQRARMDNARAFRGLAHTWFKKHPDTSLEVRFFKFWATSSDVGSVTVKRDSDPALLGKLQEYMDGIDKQDLQKGTYLQQGLTSALEVIRANAGREVDVVGLTDGILNDWDTAETQKALTESAEVVATSSNVRWTAFFQVSDALEYRKHLDQMLQPLQREKKLHVASGEVKSLYEEVVQ